MDIGELTFSQLKEKEIINISSGKKLGRVSDIVFEKNSNRVLGIVVPSKKLFASKKDELFIPLSLVNCFGDDVILINSINNKGQSQSNSYKLFGQEEMKQNNCGLKNDSDSGFKNNIEFLNMHEFGESKAQNSSINKDLSIQIKPKIFRKIRAVKHISK